MSPDAITGGHDHVVLLGIDANNPEGEGVNAVQTVIDAVRRVQFGHLMTFRNLGVLALSTAGEREADYLTLNEALGRHAVRIVEMGDGGHVPELTLVNDGDVPVLLLDGEELLGAKQNRVLNLTILAPARQACVIPVSCVEAGRWHHVSHEFVAAPRAQLAEGRAAKMRQVTSSLMASGCRSSDQQDVWSRIAEKSARLGAVSETSAMSAMFDRCQPSLEEFVTAFTPVDRQVGAVFFVNGCAAGFEMFDASGTWRTLAEKLIRSYALDALDKDGASIQCNAEADATALIHCLMSSQASVFAAVGDGEDVRFNGSGVVGGALVAAGRAIHVSAFSVESVGTSNRSMGHRGRARRNGSPQG